MSKTKYIFLIIFISFICTIFGVLLEYYYLNSKIMADPVWGLLPKAQDDPETIEEAIVRLITAHESDAGAHTGAGESLETHKAQDIIDHKAGSVLSDKTTMSEFFIEDNLKNLDGWNTSGSVSIIAWPGCELSVQDPSNPTAKIFMQSSVPSAWFDTEEDMMFQSLGKIDLSGNDYNAWIGIGIDSIAPTEGFGFIFEDGVTKAVFVGLSSSVFSDPITNDETVDHIYRGQYDALTRTAYFYIDGVLVATLNIPAGNYNYDIGIEIGIEVSNGNDGIFLVGGVKISKSI